MGTSSSAPKVPAAPRRPWPLFLGIIAFAALMAFRYEFTSIWVRAGIAACAFVALGALLKTESIWSPQVTYGWEQRERPDFSHRVGTEIRDDLTPESCLALNPPEDPERQ